LLLESSGKKAEQGDLSKKNNSKFPEDQNNLKHRAGFESPQEFSTLY